MIYADASFLASLYGWDDNTQQAENIYGKDGQRPLCLTPRQRFEVRNAFRSSHLEAPAQLGAMVEAPGDKMQVRRHGRLDA